MRFETYAGYNFTNTSTTPSLVHSFQLKYNFNLIILLCFLLNNLNFFPVLQSLYMTKREKEKKSRIKATPIQTYVTWSFRILFFYFINKIDIKCTQAVVNYNIKTDCNSICFSNFFYSL
jgi:hypothetical protein